ncbi:hypothetical protein Syun_014330 [Stephania yunnanensis]|uniref:Uncharacterized protein n=1 Tax=Stephania yunnanensis TaxID=152371 RepID=A0AAP0JL92_9MAGN
MIRLHQKLLANNTGRRPRREAYKLLLRSGLRDNCSSFLSTSKEKLAWCRSDRHDPPLPLPQPPPSPPYPRPPPPPRPP